LILNFFGLGSVNDFQDVFETFLQSSHPFLDQTTHCPSLVEFSHVIDDLLLLGAPRKANGGAPITSLHPGLPEDLYLRWLRYTEDNPDVRDTKIFLEFHNSKRVAPVWLFHLIVGGLYWFCSSLTHYTGILLYPYHGP
jgi:hypothetical protein